MELKEAIEKKSRMIQDELKNLDADKLDAIQAAYVNIELVLEVHGIAGKLAMMISLLQIERAEVGLPPMQCECPRCVAGNVRH